jgi:hypothetical protein
MVKCEKKLVFIGKKDSLHFWKFVIVGANVKRSEMRLGLKIFAFF